MKPFYKIEVKNTTLLTILIVGWAPFLPFSYFSDRQDLFKIMDSVLVAIGIGLAVGVAKGVWEALRLPAHKLTAADIGLVAVFLLSLSGSGIFAMRWYWRAVVKIAPEPILDSFWLATFTYGAMFAVILLMVALFSKDGKVVVGTTGRVAVFVAVAVLVCGVLIGLGLS
jgi:hypothetical protein